MGYVSLTKLSLLIQDKLNKLNAGNLSTTELDELKELTTELNERIIILQYKAHESQLLQTANTILHEEATQIHVKPPVVHEPVKINFGAYSNPVTQPEPVVEFKKEVVEPVAIPIKMEPVLEEIPVSMSESEPQPIVEQFVEQKPAELEKPTEQNKPLVDNSQQNKLTLVERMQKTKVENLATAIGLNQKFLFMNYLFEGENNSYNDAIEKLNNMPTAADARHYVRELAYIYSWDFENENVVLFTEYVERRDL